MSSISLICLWLKDFFSWIPFYFEWNEKMYISWVVLITSRIGGGNVHPLPYRENKMPKVRYLMPHKHQPVKKVYLNTVKPVLSGFSKIDKTNVLKTNGSLMKVESIAECSPWSILQYFWPALSNNRSWKPFFGLLFSGRLRQGLLYIYVLWQQSE